MGPVVVMARKFDVEWDDFLGGYYVGRSDVKQPANSWTGRNVGITPDKGYPIPLADPIARAETGLAGGNASGLVLTSSTGNTIVYAKGTNIYAFAWPAGATTTYAATYTAAAANPNAVCKFDKYAVFATTTTRLNVWDTVALTVSNPTIPATFSVVGTYKQWVVGANGGRMYFSSPATPSTWSSADYVDVTQATNGTIYAFLDALDALYVFTNEGTYAITGVLGQTTSQRQINREDMQMAAPAGHRVIGRVGFAPRALLGALNGSTIDTVHHVAIDDPIDLFTYSGGYALGATSTNHDLWVHDGYHNLWTLRTGVPAATLCPFVSRSDTGGYAFGAANGNVYRWTLAPVECEKNSGLSTFPSATLLLADHQAKEPFRVDHAIVEFEVGAVDTATRSVGFQVLGNGAPIDWATAGSLSDVESSPQSYQFTATQANKRMAARFTPNNAGPMTIVTPEVTLRGAKLRRVILRCTEVG